MQTDRPSYTSFRHAGSLGLLASIAAIGLSACSRDQAEGARGQALKPAARPGVPASTSAPAAPPLGDVLTKAIPGGWKLTGPVEQYTPQSLYEKIDGLADLFLSYDVAGLTVASYRKPADLDVLLDVFIYDMGTPTNAFGVFSVERSSDEPAVDIGRAAYRSEASVFVWKGQYYLKIVTADSSTELGSVALPLAQQVAAVLPDSGEKVWGLGAMPRANLVPNSLRYFRVDAMGLDFMRNTYTAQHRRGADVINVFLSRQESLGAAKAVAGQYVLHAERYGRPVERLTVAGVKLVRCALGKTFDVVFTKGRLVGGVSAVADPKVALQAATDLYGQVKE
jgi:hypothetical protein